MITEHYEDINKKSVNKTYEKALNGPRNILTGVLKKNNFNVNVQTQGSVEEGVEEISF